MSGASRSRREPTTLPGIADIRITGDDAATATVLEALREHFVITEPRAYPGGRRYFQVDTGSPHPDPD